MLKGKVKKSEKKSKRQEDTIEELRTLLTELMDKNAALLREQPQKDSSHKRSSSFVMISDGKMVPGDDPISPNQKLEKKTTNKS